MEDAACFVLSCRRCGRSFTMTTHVEASHTDLLAEHVRACSTSAGVPLQTNIDALLRHFDVQRTEPR